MANIILFIPIGILLPRKKRWLIFPFLFSALIETIQLIFLRGTFELDDIFNNTLGAVIGWRMARLANHFTKGEEIKKLTGIASAIFLSIVIILKPVTVSNLSRLLFFQVEMSDIGEVKGTAFRFDQETPQKYTILLKNTKDGKLKDIDLEYGLERKAIQDYYSCDLDYSYCGFIGNVNIDGGEYEFIIRYNPLLSIPTGVYISPQGIHYTLEETFIQPSINADFIEYGTLRAYRPDYHCWVYQYEDSLYWIAEPGFYFEDDGTTYIQYQLWTTQEERLPEKRLANNWEWDNIGGYFEKNEIQGEFGQYRVSKREIPKEYAITSIVTGYYKKGIWIWKEYFRPLMIE